MGATEPSWLAASVWNHLPFCGGKASPLFNAPHLFCESHLGLGSWQRVGLASFLGADRRLWLSAAMDFPQHSQRVLEQLNQQRQLGLLCDCTFVVDGVDFKAHKAVLAACSEYFKMLFVDQKDVVHLDISNAAGTLLGPEPHTMQGPFRAVPAGMSHLTLWVPSLSHL